MQLNIYRDGSGLLCIEPQPKTQNSTNIVLDNDIDVDEFFAEHLTPQQENQVENGATAVINIEDWEFYKLLAYQEYQHE